MGMTKDQLVATGERAGKTFFQAFVAYVLAGEVTSVYEVDWSAGFGVAALAAVLSLGTSLASWEVGQPGPSLGGEVPADEYLRVDNERRTLDQEAEIDRLIAEQNGE